MIGWSFLHPSRIHLIWIALVLVGILFWLQGRGLEALGRFVSPSMQARLIRRPSPLRRLLGLGLVLAALLGGIAALMRPQTQHAVPVVVTSHTAADVMVLVDVSRSMLAEDAAPNRLERAKAELRDLVSELDNHRVGLIAFAGRAAVLCPLTTDHGFFRMILEQVSVSSAGRGGTRIGDAIRKGVASFPPGNQAKLLLLLTDGEDQDSYPADAAKEAKQAGVRIVAIGFGDEKGSEITVTDGKTGVRGPIKDKEGRTVVSKLDGATLRSVVQETEGAYVPAGVGVLDLKPIVTSHIKPLLSEGPAPSTVRIARAERYQLCLLFSLGCLLASAWLGVAGRNHSSRAAGMHARKPSNSPFARTASGRSGASLAVALAGTLTFGGAAGAEQEASPPRRQYNEALKALGSGELDAARKGFLEARDRASSGDEELRFRAAFNLAYSFARQADTLPGEKPDDVLDALRNSAAWFRDAARLRPDDKDARVNLEVVLRRIQRLADALNKGKDGLEARLDRLIGGERELRGTVRQLMARITDAAAKSDPTAFQDEFREAASAQRTLGADANLVSELAADELVTLAAKPEAERSEMDKVRSFQLENLNVFLDRARQAMTNARGLLRTLQGDAAHHQIDTTLAELKRAREQLLDPVTILKGLVEDEAVLGLQTGALGQLRAGKVRLQASDEDERPAAPPLWLTSSYLKDEQEEIHARTAELTARFQAGVAAREQKESGAASASPDGGSGIDVVAGQSADSSTSAATADEQAERRLIEAAREALPLLGAAARAMTDAASVLATDQLESASPYQERAVENLVYALERFSGTRDLIELTHADQSQVVRLMDPRNQNRAGADNSSGSKDNTDPALASLPPAERARWVASAVARNLDRLARLERLFREEANTPPQQQQQPQPQSAASAGQPASTASGGAGDDDAEQEQQRQELYRLAEEKRRLAAAALTRLTDSSQRRAAEPLVLATEALDQIEELRRLFFSIVEHLKELARNQAEINDETASAAALSDPEQQKGLLAPSVGLQNRYAHTADALAAALAKQADAARTQNQSQPGLPADAGAGGSSSAEAQQGQQAQQAATALAEAAGEVSTARDLMNEATSGLTEHQAQASTMSFDLSTVIDQQKKALEHLAAAIRALEPPSANQGQQQQHNPDQQQSAQEQAARQLQTIRDREAERRRDRQTQSRPAEPVEKDW
ncbi:MAG: VWA domain-containing protein [Pseudomonadota bacterium]